MNEKYTIMTPFNVTQKILGPYLFSSTARETLNEKMELYFHDHAFVPLFIQVINYFSVNANTNNVLIGKLPQNRACKDQEYDRT